MEASQIAVPAAWSTSFFLLQCGATAGARLILLVFGLLLCCGSLVVLLVPSYSSKFRSAKGALWSGGASLPWHPASCSSGVRSHR